MKAVGIEEILALFVSLDPALGAPQTLPCQTPQQTLALEAVGWRCGRPYDELVRRCARDRVDQRLQGLLVDVLLLKLTATSN